MRDKVKMKEPPIGSVVIDATGFAWQRHINGWAISGSDGSWYYSWKRVLEEDLHRTLENPAKEWEPVLNDTRLPLIVYVPHEELLTEEEMEEL